MAFTQHPTHFPYTRKNRSARADHALLIVQAARNAGKREVVWPDPPTCGWEEPVSVDAFGRSLVPFTSIKTEQLRSEDMGVLDAFGRPFGAKTRAMADMAHDGKDTPVMYRHEQNPAGMTRAEALENVLIAAKAMLAAPDETGHSCETDDLRAAISDLRAAISEVPDAEI